MPDEREAQEIRDQDVEPFDPDGADDRQSDTEVAQYLHPGAGALKIGETPADFEDASEGVPVVDKSQLVGQPFAIVSTLLRPVIGNLDTGEIAYTLVMVGAVPVKLDKAGGIAEMGIPIIYVAGRDDSVHGKEIMEIADIATADNPVLVRTGLTERPTAAGNTYWTCRPDAKSVTRDLFPGDGPQRTLSR